MTTFLAALDGVLDKTLWGIDWFMIADGDAAVGAADPTTIQARSGGRLQLLPRYHIENYFLDENVLATVFDYMAEPETSWLRDPRAIREMMRGLAAPLVSYGAALRAAHMLRLSAGNVDLMPKACHGLDLAALTAAFEARLAEERSRLSSALDSARVSQLVADEFRALDEAVATDNDRWKVLLPGRPILKTFAAKTTVDVGSFKRLYVRCARNHSANPFADIRAIFLGSRHSVCSSVGQLRLADEASPRRGRERCAVA
jgi:hypothetical protein